MELYPSFLATSCTPYSFNSMQPHVLQHTLRVRLFHFIPHVLILPRAYGGTLINHYCCHPAAPAAASCPVEEFLTHLVHPMRAHLDVDYISQDGLTVVRDGDNRVGTANEVPAIPLGRGTTSVHLSK
eukprot:scaffold102124_cov22-Tisochrysis_lutea.AAC.2